MRPVCRRASPRPDDFPDYRGAFFELVARLGSYCSYCERRIITQLAVEHIQPKGLAKYSALRGRWENFLLACVNCNSTKGDTDVLPEDFLLPDRDNTFSAFEYRADGTVTASAQMGPVCAPKARATLHLVGLDKPIAQHLDENGKLVAIDRVAQRMEAWATAEAAKAAVDATPGNLEVRRLTAVLAAKTGFFSIWMVVFASDADMRNRLIDAFTGTRESGCFNAAAMPVTPAPNPDRLPNGGKA